MLPGRAEDRIPIFISVLIQPQSTTLFFYNNDMAPQTHIPTSANVLGTFGTVFWCIQLIPQIWQNWRRKKTQGVLSVMMMIWAISIGSPSVLHSMPACLLIYNPQARFHLVVMQSFRYAARKAVFGQNYDSRTYAEFQSSSPNPTTNFWCPLTRYLDPDSRLQQVTHLSALDPPFRLSLLTAGCD